jgi:Mn2+/Fe2+ NRAMP family transporter
MAPVSTLKAIIAIVGNLLLAPAAVAVILYFVNRPAMGELRATTGRNVVLAITLVFAVSLALIGAVRLVR